MKKSVFIIAILALLLCGCKEEETIITCAADLDGKKIGVQADTTGESFCRRTVKKAKVRSFTTGMDAVLDLEGGRVDAVVLDELPAKQIVNRIPDLKIITDSFAHEEYAIAVRKEDTELLEKINKTITQLRENGTYEKFIASFMPPDGNIIIPASDFYLSDDVIKMGTNAAFPPFEYIENNKVVGFDVSIAQKIAMELQAKLEVYNYDFNALIGALNNKEIDFIAAGMSVTEERKQEVAFSYPYFESEQVIIVRK